MTAANLKGKIVFQEKIFKTCLYILLCKNQEKEFFIKQKAPQFIPSTDEELVTDTEK